MRAMLFNLLTIATLVSYVCTAGLPIIEANVDKDGKVATFKYKDGATEKSIKLETAAKDAIKDALTLKTASAVTIAATNPDTEFAPLTVNMANPVLLQLPTGDEVSLKRGAGNAIEIKLKARDAAGTGNMFKLAKDVVEHPLAAGHTDCKIAADEMTVTAVKAKTTSTPLKFKVGSSPTPVFLYISDHPFDIEKPQIVKTPDFTIFVAPKAAGTKKVDVMLVHDDLFAKVDPKPTAAPNPPTPNPPSPNPTSLNVATAGAGGDNVSTGQGNDKKSEGLMTDAKDFVVENKYYVIGGFAAVGVAAGLVFSGVLGGAVAGAGAAATSRGKKPIAPRAKVHPKKK